MATVKKTIGRLPVYKGDWVAGTYSMLNQVSYLGSTFQSKIDNNTSQPATLVNNVLQVNSNWSIISNGTAAYVANDRLTACETASTYAQAGVDTLRSDVQGAIFNNASNIIDINIDNMTLYVYGKLKDSNKRTILGSSGANSKYWVAYDNGKLIGYIYTGSSGNVVATNIFSIKYPVDNPFLITMSDVGDRVISYVNGVMFSASKPSALIYSNTNITDCIVYKHGKINSVLQQQQIDLLYNQGRCDEVVFGDGYKKQYYEFNPIFKAVANAEGSEGTAVAITNGFKYSFIKKGTNPQYPRISHNPLENYIPIGSYINIEFDYNVIYGNPILGYIETTGLMNYADYDKYGQQLTGSGKVKLRSKNPSNNQANELRINFGAPDQPFEIDVTNVKIYFDSVVNEYTPKYLTKTKWIDSGANKQDITLTAPTFSYVKPYKDVEFAEGAPTTPPVASGCIRIDRTNKRAYLSILK